MADEWRILEGDFFIPNHKVKPLGKYDNQRTPVYVSWKVMSSRFTILIGGT